MRDLVERHRQMAREGLLALQECPGCGHRQSFVRHFCGRCGGRDLQWIAAGGTGTVVALTTLHRAPTPDHRERVPYSIALVALPEGPRVMAHADRALALGDRVRLGFEPLGERHLATAHPLDRGSAP